MKELKKMKKKMFAKTAVTANKIVDHFNLH